MIYLAVDPGNVVSAWVLYDSDTKEVLDFGREENEEFRSRIYNDLWGVHCKIPPIMAMEQIRGMGQTVGQTVFDTCVWVGRFVEAWLQHTNHPYVYVSRREEKMHLCDTMRAKDKNIRQAIMDRYGSTRQLAIGTKKKPGPLYGITKDKWAALAVAITAVEGER